MFANLVAATAVGAGLGIAIDAVIARLCRLGSAGQGEAAGSAVACGSNVSSRVVQARQRERARARRLVVAGATSAIFGAAWWDYGPGVMLVSRVTLGCALIALAATDLERGLLPDIITVPAMVLGVVLSAVGPPGWRASLGGLVLGGGLLLAVAEVQRRRRGEERLGVGDAKMLAMIGAYLGYRLVLLALVLGMIAGSVTALGILAVRRRPLPATLPFGVFLAIGTALAVTLGAPLLDWYVGLWR